MRPLEVYRDLGLIAGPPAFPAVGSFTSIAGPPDSSYVLFGLSLPSSALRFHKDGSLFVAEYAVTLTFDGERDSARVSSVETVRVASFGETGRADESIVFQTAVALPPGRYTVRIEAEDRLGPRRLALNDSIDVPAFGEDGTAAAAVVVYSAQGRDSLSALPQLLLNPRRTVAYGGSAPHVYVESYGADGSLRLRAMDDDGVLLWQQDLGVLDPHAALAHVTIELPVASLPIGRMWLELAEDSTVLQRMSLILSISDQWMVANFQEVLQFLTYIAREEELDSLQTSEGVERRERWDRFWARRDPVPATLENEFRDAFFDRVRFATIQFGEPGRRGWQTDRGRVYIVLGPPDHVEDRRVTAGPVARMGADNSISAQEWIYHGLPGGRIELLFIDRTGFGRFELTPASDATFRSMARRLLPRS